MLPEERFGAEGTVLILVQIPDAYIARAVYVLRTLSTIWGLPIRITHEPLQETPDIVYSPIQESGQASLHVPFDSAIYLSGTEASNDNSLDPIGSIYRLLTLLDEQQVAEEDRDQRGVFSVEALPAARRQTVSTPLVEQHAESLLSKLMARRPGLEAARLPRWPDGKQYSVVLTHDTDTVHLGAPMELAYNAVKFLVRRDATYLRMVKEGIKFLGRPMDNPLFGFPLWAEYESANDIRSCFFLSTKTKGSGFEINDWRSTVTNQRIDWDTLRRLSDRGWEFGLHSSIKAKLDVNNFLEAKADLERLIQSPIRGLRHHYWALDWRHPYRTFQMHVNAGFRYDTSMAFRDAPGFRSGTCLPYTPFDPESQEPLALYEMPTAIIDNHVILNPTNTSQAIEAGHKVMESIREVGGMAVLDWHTEAACDQFVYENFSTILKGILAPYLEDSGAWFATPWAVAQHWHERSMKLEEMSCSTM
jgi:hypothetical protein